MGRIRDSRTAVGGAGECVRKRKGRNAGKRMSCGRGCLMIPQARGGVRGILQAGQRDVRAVVVADERYNAHWGNFDDTNRGDRRAVVAVEELLTIIAIKSLFLISQAINLTASQ